MARALTEAGYQSEHVEDIGFRHAKDTVIWDYSQRNQLVIIMKDEDLVERWRRETRGPAIIWLRIGNSADAKLLGWFFPILPMLVIQLKSGDCFIEIR